MDDLTTNGYLATRVQELPASPIRALLNARRGANVLDLGGGHPEPACFPKEELRDAAERLHIKGLPAALQYSSTEGVGELRDWIAERLRHRGLAVSSEQILVTQGSQHALSTVAQVLGARERLALIEQPGYPGALQALSLAECRLGALPVTPYGWELGVIEQERPDLVYVIPHFHNPTGRRASFEQKQKLANASSKRGFFVIEDDAYGELNFDGTFNRPLIADCPERGILVGSFSKTLCPGLRIGYIVAPTLLLSALIKTLQATTLQPGTLAQVLAFETLSRLDYDTYLERLRSFYRQRAMALSRRCRALGLEHLMPDGGFFLWVKTPGCASEFAQQAAASGVLAVPEIAFRASGMRGPNQHLRLAFSRYDDATTAAEKLEQAVMSVTFKTVRT